MDTMQPRPPDSVPPAGGRPPHPIRLSSPTDVLAVIPHLLGFHPARSLVVLGAEGTRERVGLGFRYDLPDPPDPAAAAGITEHAAAVLRQRELPLVIVVGYGPGPLVTPLADALIPALRRRELTLHEMVRTEHGRYWSYLCSEPGCCPPEGVPFDIGAHPATAAMAEAGLTPFPDRDALAGTLAPVAGEAAESMSAAADRAGERAARLVERAGRQGSPGFRRLISDQGRRAVREAIAAYRDGRAIGDDQFAWLALTLAEMRVRDDAWARMDPAHNRAHLRLWTDLVRHADPGQVAPAASLLAFTAWQAGDGALASIAVERALAADPGYSMAELLRDIVDAGVPPSEARLPMTPADVARSYARADRKRAAASRPRRPRPRPGRPPGRGTGQRDPVTSGGAASEPGREAAQ
jgi:hypothetical protein